MISMKNKTKPDIRPRFGWTTTIDDNPQRIFEERGTSKKAIPVVVIPMISGTRQSRARVMRLWKSYWWPME